MKKLIVYILAMTFVVVSCMKEAQIVTEGSPLLTEKSTNNCNSPSATGVESFSNMLHKGVTLVCNGGCGCQVSMVLGSGKAACTCDDCAMDITFEGKPVQLPNTVQKEQLNYLLGLPLYKQATEDLKTYASKKYKVQLEGFNQVDFVVQENLHVITFYFEDEQGNTQSVLYSRSQNNSKQLDTAKTFRVDCTGGCGCKEEFNFNNNTASCSCTDCAMDVSEVQSK